MGYHILTATNSLPPAKAEIKKTFPAEVADLSVYIFIFDQGSDLPVKHPIELCYQYDFIAQVSMQREEREPGTPVFTSPVPTVKKAAGTHQ